MKTLTKKNPKSLNRRKNLARHLDESETGTNPKTTFEDVQIFSNIIGNQKKNSKKVFPTIIFPERSQEQWAVWASFSS